MLLHQVCDLIVDCEHKTAPTQATGFPSIRTPNIGRGFFILDGVNRVSEATYRQWTRRAAPKPGDLIMAREAPVGNVAVIPEGLQPCLGQRTLLIRPNPAQVDSRYLCYLLLGDEVQSVIHSQTNGATVPHLNMADVRELPLPELPPLGVQRKTAAVLSAYDDLIENNTRRIRILEEMARALYREWFIEFRFPDDDGARTSEGHPTGWDRVPFDDALVLQRGFDLPIQNRNEGNVPVYGSTGVVGFHDESRVKGPGVVTGRSGTLGDVHFVRADFWPLNTCLWVREFKRVSPAFAKFLLESMGLKQYNGGASVPTLDRKAVHRVPIVVPPKDLVSQFNAVVEPTLERIDVLARQSDVLRRTRDLLLPRLMSGQMSPAEAVA